MTLDEMCVKLHEAGIGGSEIVGLLTFVEHKTGRRLLVPGTTYLLMQAVDAEIADSAKELMS